jgi:hypothetical protein
MKKTFVRFAFALTVLTAGTSLFGASSGQLRVSVPFEFTVAGSKMPAGDYSIQETGENGTLVIYCLSTKRSIMVLSAPGAPSAVNSNPALTFERTSSGAVLTKVVTDSAIARSLPTAR